MSLFPLLVIIHALAATVWTGAHLVLDLGVLPKALRAQSAQQIRAFEDTFEPLGLTALAHHARLRLIPTLSDDSLAGLAWRIRAITTLAITFVVVGALIRLGGLS